MYQQMMLDIHSSIGASEMMPAEITDLVGYIWNEANGELNDVLSVPVEGIKLEQIEKAEAALLSIKLILDGTNKEGDMQKLTNEFYSSIPHKQKTKLDTKRAIAEKQDLCQVDICIIMHTVYACTHSDKQTHTVTHTEWHTYTQWTQSGTWRVRAHTHTHAHTRTHTK